MNILPKQRILKMFGEYANITSEDEKEEARSYLHMWKKYLIRRLSRDSYDVKIIDVQWGERPSGSLMQLTDMYLKILVEFEWKYDDHLSKLEGIDISESNLLEKNK
jgi:hypothetical protein